MTKILFTPLLTCPQGCQGCQKIWTTKLKSTLLSWSSKIQPKFKKLWKTIKIEQKLSNKPCFLKVLQISFNLDWILAEWTSVWLSRIFWDPWHPWGRVNTGVMFVLRFVFDIFVRSAIWCFFSFFLKWSQLSSVLL